MYITNGEKRVLELLYLTNKEIAQKLFIDISTVKSHIHNLLVKFKAKTRTELFMKAIKSGEIKL
jgi:DNA-binding NarL/FixJ family response regulator